MNNNMVKLNIVFFEIGFSARLSGKGRKKTRKFVNFVSIKRSKTGTSGKY